MDVGRVDSTRQKLTTPRAAAIAGILFAILYGTGLAIIRFSIPADATSGTDWLDVNSKRVDLAFNLVPYAGIAFLWFIGVIRDRLGEMEDRFFATVFLGSGLMFLGLTFTGAALSGGMLHSYSVFADTPVEAGLYTYNRAVVYDIINIYAVRMSGVFMISLSTIWLRTGLMHRSWAIVTYVLALILLLSIGHFLWVALIFPAWVLVVSLYILLHNADYLPESGVG